MLPAAPEMKELELEKTVQIKIEDELAQRLGEPRYQQWFAGKCRWYMDGQKLTVAATSSFAAQWIRGKLMLELRHSAAVVLGEQVTVEVATPAGTPRSEPAVDAVVPPPQAHPPSAASPPVGVSRLNPKYLLEEFVAGPSNQMAFRAAVQAAESTENTCNPLFIHGRCGLGKTHLLQGICRRFGQKFPQKRWLYLTGEEFTNEFVEAIRQNKTSQFRRRLRQSDLLVIDDIHFFTRKQATQEEFLHTFNQVDGAGRRIVLASDCAPGQIASIMDALQSRFVSGMVARIDPPDLPTRLEIVRRHALRLRRSVSDAILMHVAQSPAASVRELEGLLLQVLTGLEVAVEAGETVGGTATVIAEQVRCRAGAAKVISAEHIIETVAGYFGLAAADLRGNRRSQLVAGARAIAIYLMRQHSHLSFPEIGRILGDRNHSTAVAANQRVETRLTTGWLLRWVAADGPHHEALGNAIANLNARLHQAQAA